MFLYSAVSSPALNPWQNCSLRHQFDSSGKHSSHSVNWGVVERTKMAKLQKGDSNLGSLVELCAPRNIDGMYSV